MKCADCQFHLLCHAGRLDAWSPDQQSTLLLCPKCNRLSVGQHETVYVFSCELRQLNDDELATVERLIERGDVTQLSSVRIPDRGPGLIGELTLALCFACLDALPIETRSIRIKYLDENREEPVKERLQRQREAAVVATEATDGEDNHDTCTSDLCMSQHSGPCEDE